MAYYEGIDYRVVQVPFPNLASECVTVLNPDGTYTIVMNSRFPVETLRARLPHELRHIVQEHCYQRDRAIWEREAEAEGRSVHANTPVPEPEEWEDFAPQPGREYFASWGAAMAWARARMKKTEE